MSAPSSVKGINSLSFNESVELERDMSRPDSDFTGSGLVRRHLFRGESISANDVAALTGRTPGLINMVVKYMALRGFVFEEKRERPGAAAYYRLVNPDLPVAQFDEAAVKANGQVVSKANQERKHKQTQAETGDEPEPESETANERKNRLARNGRRRRLAEAKKQEQEQPDPTLPVPTRVAANAAALNREQWIHEQGTKSVTANGQVPVNGNGNGNGHGVAVPAFGTRLRVTLLAENEDGQIRVGFKDDTGATWLCQVEGYVAAPA